VTGTGPRQILVIGYYGAGNTGDEAVLISMLRALRAGRPDLQVVVPGENPERLASVHSVISFPVNDLSKMLDAVESADLVILGGGGLLHDYWDPLPETLLTPGHWGLTYYCGIPWLAAQLGKPVMIYGAGVGPLLFESGRDLVRDVAMASQAITVRDEESARLLKELGVRFPKSEVTADPVWDLHPVGGASLDGIWKEAGLDDHQWLGVAVRNWNVGVEQDAWEGALLEAVEPFAREHKLGVLFFPFQHAPTPLQNDVGLAKKLAEAVKSVPATVFDRVSTPEELAGAIGRCTVLVGMRLHSLIFACMTGVPAVGLEYDPKVAHLARMLDPPMPTVRIAQLSCEALSGALQQLWDDLHEARERELALAGRMRRLAAKNNERALTLLTTPPVLPVRPKGKQLLEAARKAATRKPPMEEREPEPVVRILTGGFFDSRGENMFFGGAERYLIELARVIRSLGYAVEIFQRAEGEPWKRNYGDILVEGVPASDPFDINEEVAAATDGRKVALTIYHAFYMAGRACPPGSIGVSHGIYWDDQYYQKDEAERRRHRARIFASLESLGALVSVDANTINWIRAERADLVSKCTRLPNFVDLNEFRDAPSPGGERPVVLYPRRLHPPRGFWLVAEVVPRILASSREVEFHFVGKANPAEEEAVRKLISRYPNNVSWEFLPPERMSEAYRRADIVLIPSVAAEGTSLSCLEAQACGKALIATHVGGLPELILHEHNGLLIAPEAGALQEAITRLLGDPGLRTRLGENASAVARSFGINGWRERWLSLLQRFLSVRADAKASVESGADAPDEEDREESAQTQIRSLQASLAAEQARLRAAESELARIRGSRLWKVGGVYWKLRATLGARTAGGGKAVAGNSAPWPASTAARRRPPIRRPTAPPDRLARSVGAVVMVPSIGWNITLVQRPHYIARSLARAGRPVVYDCSFQGNADDEVEGFREIEPNLFLYRGTPPHWLTAPFLWAYPYNIPDLSEWPGARLVYDLIDDLGVFPYPPEFVKSNHDYAMKRAAAVFAVSRPLLEQCRPDRPDAVYLPNGVDISRFEEVDPSRAPAALKRLKERGRPIAGYVGSFSKWRDVSLFETVAREMSEWDFVLVGVSLDGAFEASSLGKISNVHFLGPVPHDTVPACLTFFDVGLEPFTDTAMMNASSPLKLYEYFAAGKPVVSTPLPEAQAFSEVFVAGSLEEWRKALAAAYERRGDEVFRARLRDLSRRSDWSLRAQEILKHLI
jgi:polysaccharide pyruvyl transferase CsaB